MTTQELTIIINQMTDEERLILSRHADAIIAKRNLEKGHTKQELLARVRQANQDLAEGKKLKSAKVFLAEIREEYGIRA